MTTETDRDDSLYRVNLEKQLVNFPDTMTVVESILNIWPEHLKYCEARFRNHDEAFEHRVNDISELALRIVGGELPKYCSDYRWMCEEFRREEIYFSRHGKYRLSTFDEAYREVYANPEYMSRYVRGILLSQIIWEPHARAFDFFRTGFLPLLPAGSAYLEVGPGHGLFLYFASTMASLDTLEAWDVSDSSIAETRAALSRLGATREFLLVEQDVLRAPPRSGVFDGAVISEVLEHLERPDLALRSLHAALKPGGRVFINAPINSPAPDHIYLWSSTDEFVSFVGQQGFEIERAEFFPVTGVSLDRARRQGLSISCVVIGRKSGRFESDG